MTNIVFGFCIYGSDPKYYNGLTANLKIISDEFAGSRVIISYTPSTNASYLTEISEKYPFVSQVLHEDSCLPRMGRMLNIDLLQDNETYFSRDTDSRITPRDIWCIRRFLSSDKTLHSIRDHFYHKSKLMAGMFGIRKPSFSITELFAEWRPTNTCPDYGSDERFLDDIIYPKLKSDLLVHTNVRGSNDELVELIDCPQTDDNDFIGNVINADGSAQFGYKSYITYDIINNETHPLVIVELSKQIDIQQVPYDKRYSLLMTIVRAHIKNNDAIGSLATFAKFRYAHIDDEIIHLSSSVLSHWNIVASFDPNREPKTDNEIVIQYGEYPHTVECMPTPSRVLRRHPIYFEKVKHDTVEYNDAFESIGQIYILNLIERRDRYMMLLIELCRINAPLHRIVHYKAMKDPSQTAYAGATKNHLDVVDAFTDTFASHCLVLEDDVVFITDTTRLWAQLKQVLHGPYDYDACFLAYSKYGPIVEHDHLVSISHQECTTSSAYLLKRETAGHIRDCLKIGYDEMLAGGDPNIYCCDRYWCRRKGRLFVFRDKVAYQRVCYSDLKQTTNMNFD
jgi:hypothetical protein